MTLEKNILKYLLPFFLLLMTAGMQAQQSVLEWEAVRPVVLEKSPAAQQARLFAEQAEAALLRARGGFDPKLFAGYESKQFKDKTYFQHSESGVKVPTWAGLEVKGSYLSAAGAFLNPEESLPANGQATLGISWTLGQGLLIDDRRADLFQARIGLRQGNATRDELLNELVLLGAKAYWEWVLHDNQLNIYDKNREQAQIRYQALRESFRQGERPAIDTLETFIQLQNRLLDVNFASVERRNAALELSNFYWPEGRQEPERISAYSSPALTEGLYKNYSETEMEALVQVALDRHPALRNYTAKLEYLEVEKRLKNEKRKPELNLSYNLLGSGWEFFPSTGAEGAAVFARDIKWGVNFSYPLLNRKARGDFQVTKVKIAQTRLDLQQKQVAISNKVRQYANELNTLSGQITLYRSITNNYRTLLDAENIRFSYGESSIFLLNTREQRWLEAQIKLLKLCSEYRKAEAGLNWAMGTL